MLNGGSLGISWVGEVLGAEVAGEPLHATAARAVAAIRARSPPRRRFMASGIVRAASHPRSRLAEEWKDGPERVGVVVAQRIEHDGDLGNARAMRPFERPEWVVRPELHRPIDVDVSRHALAVGSIALVDDGEDHPFRDRPRIDRCPRRTPRPAGAEPRRRPAGPTPRVSVEP